MQVSALSGEAVLRAWERGGGLHPIDRALVLCACVAPALDGAALAALSLGERDALLLALHEQTFGGRIEAVVACPACAAPLELSFSCAALQVAAPAAAATVVLAGRELQLRKLDSRDLAAIAASADAAAARRLLLARAVVGDAGALSDDDERRLAERLGELDPQADLLFELSCGECQHRFAAPFDVADFVWCELSIEARRLMQEVASLARAYKWSEGDILAMSRKRRQHYLELADA